MEAVYAGGMFLSESDLRSCEGNGTVLTYPGTTDVINGVVPLESLDPQAYKLYSSFGGLSDIAELQASVTLRGALARVPYDTTARDTAVYLHLVRRDSARSGSEAIIVESLGVQVGHRLAGPTFTPLAEALLKKDAGAYLTGDMGVSGPAKPLALLLTSWQCHGLRSTPDAFTRALRAVYVFEAYCNARAAYRNDAEARERDLYHVLGIDNVAMADTVNVGAPGTADPPYTPHEPCAPVCLERALLLPWMPSIDDYCRLGAHALQLKDMTKDELMGRGNIDASLPRTTMILAAAVEALACSKEEERVDKEKRVCRGPEPGDYYAAMAYVNKAHDAIYRAAYDKAIGAKRWAERNKALADAVRQMLECDDLDMFVALLTSSIVNRSAPGCAELEASLLDTNCEAQQRYHKVFVLATGRDPRPGHAVVWNLGNVNSAGWAAYVRLFEGAGLPDMLAALHAVRAVHGVHRYRASDKPNRCGHCNSRPSFSAYGFASLEEYRVSVTPAQWETYVAQHTKCCGFARAK